MTDPIDPDALPDRYYCYMDDDGTLHKADIETGAVVASSPRFEDGLVPGQQMHPEFLKGRGRHWVYNETYHDLICNALADGLTLTEICKKPGFPGYHVISRWRSQHPEFRAAMTEAKKMKAEIHADMVALSLEEIKELGKDEVPAYKLYIDCNKWLAEKNDPDAYGNRVKHAGDKDQPLTITVDTGIHRDEPPQIDFSSSDEENTIEGELNESD